MFPNARVCKADVRTRLTDQGPHHEDRHGVVSLSAGTLEKKGGQEKMKTKESVVYPRATEMGRVM